MNRLPITSSNINSAGYDSDTFTLEVEFNSGGIYQYNDVPEEVYSEFIQADSQGIYFNAHIRNVYSTTQL